MIIDSPEKMILTKEDISIQVQKQIEQEYKLIGKMRVIPGLKLYEFNYQNFQLKECEVKDMKAVRFDTEKKSENKKVNYDSKCIYFQSHCLRTATKKADKIIEKLTGIKNYSKNTQIKFSNNKFN